MNRISVFVLAMLSFAGAVFAQEKTEEFKPHGKPFMKVFTNFHSTVADGETTSAFELTRVYLGYEYFFSENFSGKANFDVGNPGAGKHEMAAYVKNAYLNYKSNGWSINFGLISTTQFKVQEKHWGYRYLAKSFQDEFKFASSADLGISVAYKFSDVVSADLAVYNGEGYKKLESDNAFKTGLGLTLKPVNSLTVRGFYDFMPKDDVTQNSLIGFVGYAAGNLSLGAEYNLQNNKGYVDGQNWYGTSFYATYKASKMVKLFARYDSLNSDELDGENDPWNLAKDGNWLILGLEYAPVKGVKITPNFKGWNPADENQAYQSTFILNCEIKF